MAKSLRRDGRKTTDDRRGLLDRIRDTPHLAHVIPRLQPEVLHRVIETCGLEDCSDLVAMATPDQLQRVFDLDLWRAEHPGQDEQLDVDRFGVWLEVLMDAGAVVAAQKLMGMDAELVIAALSQHLRVFDAAAASPYTTLDGERIVPEGIGEDTADCEIGGYLIEARRTVAWDVIVDLLVFLDGEHPSYFHRVMRGCCELSCSAPEIDGLHDLLGAREQDMFDVTADREERRGKTGFVVPADARAFLQSARQLRLDEGTAPCPSPVARAYFQEIQPTSSADTSDSTNPGLLAPAPGDTPVPDECADAFAAVVELLTDAGVVAQPRALLRASEDVGPQLTRIQQLLHAASESGHSAHSARTQELAYLANVIIAGCSIQARPFTARESSEAAAAICNLGLENWPRHWPASDDLLSVFQVGWTVLHDEVCMPAAGQLLTVLADVQCGDGETQAGIEALRAEMTKHWRAGTPWRAREALEVIAILDLPAWAGLLGLIDECPVMHGSVTSVQGRALRTIDPSAFTFVSENSQIAVVQTFLHSLADRLRP
jgi:hypothetical protein